MKFIIPVLFCIFNIINALQLVNEKIRLELTPSENGLHLSLQLESNEKLTGFIGDGKNLTDFFCENNSACTFTADDFSLTIALIDSGFNFSWESNNIDKQFQDCFDLNKDKMNWFGGPERYTAQWPIENLILSNQPYRISKLENGAVAERYWLNSKGAYIFIGDRVPLFLEQNSWRKDSLCFVAKIETPFINRNRVLLEYSIVAKSDAKQAHLHAVENFLGKPQGHPNERIIRHPIWTTWAKYKTNISDDIVLQFARDIASHNFTGQIEIDDFWETCYGSLIFNDWNFNNINSTVNSLKKLGFTVTLWVHPFVNDDCEVPKKIGRENDYFVKSVNGSDFTSWWNGNFSHHIDFTKEKAREWFVSRLKLLQEKHGIDSFKFDAGENDWAPADPVLNSDIDLAPNILTASYLETCAAFGDLIEVRSGWRTQTLPVFVRILDKDSRWGLDNGLHSLITNLLQMNINGYTLVLPDMIGGNGYGDDVVTAELLVRWTQANVFMPSMQFSYLPWEITSEKFDCLEIVRKCIALHENYTGEIMKAINASINQGIPVNPPVWWVDPTNEEALKINDEFMLGESILVAPVIKEGVNSRRVLLPAGLWKDGNNGTLYKGPLTIEDYSAPIEILPYFIKQ